MKCAEHYNDALQASVSPWLTRDQRWELRDQIIAACARKHEYHFQNDMYLYSFAGGIIACCAVLLIAVRRRSWWLG